MRRPSIYTDRREELDVKMTPMIDVVFLLLIFFVWTASFQMVEYMLPSQLSVAVGSADTDLLETPPPELDFDDVVVRIRQVGGVAKWTVNDTDIASESQLSELLARIADIRSEAPVIVHPDQDVPLGEVIHVYDIAKQVGFHEVSFATSDRV